MPTPPDRQTLVDELEAALAAPAIELQVIMDAHYGAGAPDVSGWTMPKLLTTLRLERPWAALNGISVADRIAHPDPFDGINR